MSTAETVLKVHKRESRGKGASRRLRAASCIPGVFYMPDGTNISVQVDTLPLEKVYTNMGRTSVFTLEIDDNGANTRHPVLVWDVQYHPYKKAFTHVDFYGVDLNKPVKVSVAIEFTGTASGVKLGGRLETYREKVLLISKPLDMPKKIVVDVTALGLGDTVRVGDIALPKGVRAASDSNFAIVSVISKADEAAEESASAS